APGPRPLDIARRLYDREPTHAGAPEAGRSSEEAAPADSSESATAGRRPVTVALLRPEHPLEQRSVAGGLELHDLSVAICEHVDLVGLAALDCCMREDHDPLIV